MNITKYIKSGCGCVFVESTEIKRASNSIQVDLPYKIAKWNILEGLQIFEGDEIIKEELDQMELLHKVSEITDTAIICENMDWFFESEMWVQALLNNYSNYKYNNSCIVIVGTNIKNVPERLKALIPILSFDLPDKETIQEILNTLVSSVKENTEDKSKLKDVDLHVPADIINACSGLSYEEIENVLSLSLIENKCFDLQTIYEHKKQVIRATGFMDYANPEPIENLGGLQNFKDYLLKRKEAYEENSIKPKIKSMLLCGIPGVGKSLACKVVASILDWPLVTLDIGSLKGSLVGETEKNIRHVLKVIDGIGKVVILADEIEKSLSGSNAQTNLDSGTSSGMMGTLLTWLQERQSEGILVATANNIDALPPEFLRAGRWDALFVVNQPNVSEIKSIIEIMNKKHQANLPNTKEFCSELFDEGWTGAEIELLAKDSHFDSLETAKENIPLLSQYKQIDIDRLKQKTEMFRVANERTKSNFFKKKKITKNRIGF